MKAYESHCHKKGIPLCDFSFYREKPTSVESKVIIFFNRFTRVIQFRKDSQKAIKRRKKL